MTTTFPLRSDLSTRVMGLLRNEGKGRHLGVLLRDLSTRGSPTDLGHPGQKPHRFGIISF